MRISVKESCEQIRGVSYKPSDITDGASGIPLLRANNIGNGSLNFEELIYVSPNRVSDEQYLRDGDILVCTSSGSKSLVGKAGVYHGQSGLYTFGAFCKVVRSKAKYDPEFIGLFFSSGLYRKEISAKSHGANINNIKADDLDSLSFSYYGPSENAEMVKELNRINRALSIKRAEDQNLENMVKSRFMGVRV